MDCRPTAKWCECVRVRACPDEARAADPVLAAAATRACVVSDSTPPPPLDLLGPTLV